MKGLLNGYSEMRLDNGIQLEITRVVEAEGSWKPCSITLQRTNHVPRWSREINDIWGDPTSHAHSSLCVDFRAFHWAEAGVLVLAGQDKAVVVTLDDGEIAQEIPLEFVGKPSLDILTILVDGSSEQLVICSTKKFVCLDRKVNVRWTWIPDGLPKGIVKITQDSFTVEQYDLQDPYTPIVRRRLNFDKGIETP